MNLALDSERRRNMWEDRWKQGGDGTGQQQQQVKRQVTDDEDGDERQQGGQQQLEDRRKTADDDGHETRQGGQQQQGSRQQVDRRGEKQSLEELIQIVKFRMRQEEKQEQTNGEEEARRESEIYREKRESEPEIRWEIGKRRGTRRGEMTARGEERKVGGTIRQEGKGRGNRQKVWEDWWRVREEGWMNEEWEELSGEVVDVGENGNGIEARIMGRDSEICKAEKLGEEMGIEIKGTWKGKERRRERWRSPAEKK